MKYKLVLYKQIDNGNIAHIYEHIVADVITAELLKNEFYRNLDYKFYASQDDGIVRLAIYTSNKKIYTIVKLALKNHKCTQKEIDDAISQISVEKEMLATCDMKLLLENIANLDRQAWLDFTAMGFTDSPSPYARQYKTKEISLTRQVKAKFSTYEITYEIDNCPKELRPLALYVLDSIGLSVIDIICRDYKDVYDAGDMWAVKHDNFVGYLNFLKFPKNKKYSKTIFKKYQKELIDIFSQPDIAKRIARYASSDFACVEPYFSDRDMYDRTGHFVGVKEFEKQATYENVLKIVNSIKLDVIENN